MKIYIQTSFEQAFEKLLINTDLQSKKVGYEPYIKTHVWDYSNGTFLVKHPQSQVEKGIENLILTLELLYQLPISFEGNPWVEYDIKKYIYELYENNITEQTEQNLNFLVYTSLLDCSAIEKITEFAKNAKGSVDVSIDIVAIPCAVSSIGEYDSNTILKNLNHLSELKNSKYISNVFFLDAFDEDDVPMLWDIKKLSNVCADLLITNCTISSEDSVLNNSISTIGVQRLEIDKFSIINNWAINIFKRLCHDVIGDKNNEPNKDKVNRIFQDIIDEERKGLEKINNLPDDQVPDFLYNWKDNLKEKILNKIIDANLNNSEKDLLLSYFQNITNRDLLQLEDFDIEKLSLFDNLYIPFIDQTIDKENPYSKLKEIILQIQKIKKDMEERQRRINDTKELIDHNYRRDGKWTDDGYQIGDDIFKIHKNDGLGDSDYSDELFTDYEPNNISSLPKNADLKSFFPPVKNQKQQGACSSFSLTSVFEYFLSNELRKYSDMSEAYVYYNGRVESGNTDKDSGANLFDVIKGMADKGVCIEELCKYDPDIYSKEPSVEAYADGERRKVTSAKRVAVNVGTIKSAINDGYPVVGCFRVFESWQENTSGFIPMPTEAERLSEKDGFHAMVICGYNDKHGHFIVRNSWGTDFGDKGYCYLPYSYVRDSDLTRYAVAISGINAKEFIKHDPIKDDFDFSNKDKNIQYAILLNLLKEDEHILTNDRQIVKGLIDDLRKLIEEIKSKDDIDDLKDKTDNQIEEIDKRIKQLQGQIFSISIWDNKLVHIIHGIIMFISWGVIGYGLYDNSETTWEVGTAASAADLISWIVSALLSKRNRKNSLLKDVEENQHKKNDLINRIDQKKNLRDRVIQILNTIGDIEDSSMLNRELLNLIILTLNDCYDKITDYLNNNYPIDEEGGEIVFPEWYSEFIADFKISDFFRQLFINHRGNNFKIVLYDIQKKILEYFDEKFNKKASDYYDDTSEWNKFVNSIIDNKVYAKFKDHVNPNEIIERSWLLSDLYMPDIQVNSNYCNFDKNRYIYLHIKEVNPYLLDLKP